ncbi:MAG: oligosaccharide flippase family protein, partial [Actinobacteria bacterium]|nr:oligosaccharide flippase family protein [Actinomycetota bacterium]
MASVKHNTVFVGVGQVLRIVMAFMLLPVASRVLGDESFGRYNLATTIMFFVMLVDDFGLNMWVTREIARFRDRAQRYFAYTAGLKFSLILASFVFVAVLVPV